MMLDITGFVPSNRGWSKPGHEMRELAYDNTLANLDGMNGCADGRRLKGTCDKSWGKSATIAAAWS